MGGAQHPYFLLSPEEVRLSLWFLTVLLLSHDYHLRFKMMRAFWLTAPVSFPLSPACFPAVRVDRGFPSVSSPVSGVVCVPVWQCCVLCVCHSPPWDVLPAASSHELVRKIMMGVLACEPQGTEGQTGSAGRWCPLRPQWTGRVLLAPFPNGGVGSSSHAVSPWGPAETRQDDHQATGSLSPCPPRLHAP